MAWRFIRHASTHVGTESKHLSKILIANRGEIACRIMRTARRMGIRTVAVYSDADAKAMHVEMADEAYNIGPAASAQSYLRGDKLVDLAHKTGAEGIHPGYGFLSENAEFADLCQSNKVIFIGPPASAIRSMGSKSESKIIMSASSVPIIDGYHGDNQQESHLLAEAERIGFPVLIKAVKGGGGKGMRIVHEKAKFAEALESSRRESLKSFGDDKVLVEKYVQLPRHIEVQVFADHYGNTVYLSERDCSVQRRYQKVLEEAPGPGLSAETRKELGEAAVRAAKAVGYVGAGTVEFIFDAKTSQFYFMEMNTRLQVEHPITEMVTGTDLVEWQLRVAAGQRLPLLQDEIKVRGHAFEARVYAENPEKGFLPGSGPLKFMRTPTPSDTVRVDTGVRQGDEVTVHYDPMIAKLVVYGSNRAEALAKTRLALRDFQVAGLSTNLEFLHQLASHPKFVAADVSTHFIQDNHASLFPPKPPISPASVALAVLALQSTERIVKPGDAASPWVTCTGRRINDTLVRTLALTHRGKELSVEVTHTPAGFDLKWEGGQATVSHAAVDTGIRATVNGVVVKGNYTVLGSDVHIFTPDGHEVVTLNPPAFASSAASSTSSNALAAPMNGKVERINCAVGQTVAKDQALVVMEAMKMELVLRAPRDGKIAKILFTPGTIVNENSVIVELEPLPKA
eukprot:m.221027 g.221027  ORF g.221027 m.221027 type:complete len:682 (+) comp15701_c0_seq1:425-2470(+)